MKLTDYVIQSARHYGRGHLGLLLGTFLAATILTGSLLVGDSVRASLQRVAALRLGMVEGGVLGGDHWFTEGLARKCQAAPVIIATGSASATGGKVRVNGAQVMGVDAGFWKLSTSSKAVSFEKTSVAINEPLARKLGAKVGDTILVRMERPSAISRDAPLSGSTNQDISLRRTVAAVVSAEDFGAFQLIASQVPPDTVFVNLADLQNQLEMDGRVNAMLHPQFNALRAQLEKHRTLEDFSLSLKRIEAAKKEWEISTSRVFLENNIASKLIDFKGAYGVLTYLVNGITSKQGGTPYSMVTATGTGKDDEITITQWLADDQKLAVGDELEIKYFVVGLGRDLKQESAKFKVAGILPMDDPRVTKAWTPEFPGVSDVDNCRDWEPGIPMDMKAIRDKDEEYWDEHKGTPKGFITLAAGQKLWSNRFGKLTAIRLPNEGQTREAKANILALRLQLADIGLVPRDFKHEAGNAAQGSVDFGGLFIGLSMFLIAAALVFAALLFLFTLERRASQIGLLLAMGWTRGMVRRAWLLEAGVIAVAGVLLGVFGGMIYTQTALHGLSAVWSGATQGLPLVFSASFGTVFNAALGTLIVVLLTLAWASRKLFKVQARDLLAGTWADELQPVQDKKPAKKMLPLIIGGVALALLPGGFVMKNPEAVAGMFFGSGMLMLVAGLLVLRGWMRRDSGSLARTLWQIGARNISRRPSRSLAVIGMMAGGIFLVVAVNAFRMSAGDATERRSGTGGFALVGESSLPVYEDLNAKAGWDAFGLDEKLMPQARVVPFRIREGDDASCLNLNRAQKPVLVAADPAKLSGTFAFASVSFDDGTWDKLNDSYHDSTYIPAIADQATAMWGLGKGVGDTLDYQDSTGKTFQVKLVGLLAGSVLQGKMIISEKDFLSKYPDAAGYRFFLVDAKPDKAAEISEHLTRQLEQRGLALEPARQRLELFLSVQNTYIGIFTVLGGLGVLLGTAGIGVLIARHVLERRGELGLMQALGFQAGALRGMILGEHGVLLVLGVILGVFTAALAVLPQLIERGGGLPVGFLGQLITAVLVFGLVVCVFAVGSAVRGRLTDAIRRE
ncbi:FtsX-like permease family protein [Prosthecobacter vanneervenii]|uniref:ABC-type antimicrobial peptide transport system permease subunit n=1 Tax=Prosthecobacter vanneervenii TaxID=48466 RepID=A0A7W7Y787_9BACT|nr:FtsX-like permease family protein [Prosthecobacter vanneervenii]MBB5030923.1 ABC-type antimicrobial peptide transport system permease subunit [Prosthecobacter vanneervenii]